MEKGYPGVKIEEPFLEKVVRKPVALTKKSLTVDFVCAQKRKNTIFQIIILPFWMQLKIRLYFNQQAYQRKKENKLNHSQI